MSFGLNLARSLALLILITSSCRSVDRGISPISAKATRAHLTVVKSAQVATHSKAIAAIAFDQTSNRIFSVDTEGHLRARSLLDQKVKDIDALGNLSLGATRFFYSKWLATSQGSAFGVPSNMPGFQIWDLETGSLLTELTKTIPTKLSAIALNLTGTLLFGVGSGGYSAYEVKTKTEVFAAAWSEGDSNISQFDVVDIDRDGKYAASVNASGSVWVFPINLNKRYWERVSEMRVAPPVVRNQWSEKTLQPLAIAFDPTRNWLVVVFNDKLAFYSLKDFRKTFETDFAIGGKAAAIAFGNDGSVVAIGSEGGWQLWGVEGNRLIVEDRSTPTFALAFSPDGRYFATGDAQGTVQQYDVHQ